MEDNQEKTENEKNEPQNENNSAQKIEENNKVKEEEERKEENIEKGNETKNNNTENNNNGSNEPKNGNNENNNNDDIIKKNQEYEKIIEELKLSLQQKEKNLEELKLKVEENEKNLFQIKNEKMQIQKKNINLQTNIATLQARIEKINNEKNENNSKLELEVKNLNASLEDLKSQNKIINQAAKQIFIQYLTNDLYIESIEKCFNTQDINKYFENTYNLSEHIKPNIIIEYWKNLLTKNKELVNKIDQYNLDTSLENILKEFENFKNLEEIKKIENQEFIIKLLQEMTDYITNLRKTIMNQSNTIEEKKYGK